MKKLLLTGLLIVFAGIGLAETPTIVNPPRPTRKFEWLIVIKHNLEHDDFISPKTHIHFVYTNQYSVKGFAYADENDSRDNKKWHVELSGESEEIIFVDPKFEYNIRPSTWKIMLFTHWDGLPSTPVFLELFCVAKAPNPNPHLNLNLHPKSIFNTKFRISSQAPIPQKAKVVFR